MQLSFATLYFTFCKFDFLQFFLFGLYCTMFRIGEFSKLTQVSVRMLRYYDETGILTPAEVDKWTGHRLYSVEQIPRLNKILYLRDSGLNVSEIALALTKDEQSLLTQLDKKRMEIENAIQAEQEKLQR